MNELSEADWDLTMALNLTAPFLLGQCLGPAMAARGWGRIINVTSQQAQRAFGNSGAYGVSKGGVASLTRSQSEVWAKHGVPADFAGVAVFLASNACDFVTGSTIYVDGGFSVT